MPMIGPSVAGTGAFAATRQTLGDIKGELARPYDASDETNLALAQDAWNSAVRAYNRYLWPWERLTADLTVTAGTATYTLPTTFKAPLALFELSASREHRRLGYIPFDSYVSGYSLDQTGSPQYYTLANQFETGQLTLWPRPMGSGTYRAHYYRQTPTAQTDGAAVEAPDYAVEAMKDWARYLMVSFKLGGQSDRISVAYRQARESRAELVQMVEARGDNTGDSLWLV